MTPAQIAGSLSGLSELLREIRDSMKNGRRIPDEKRQLYAEAAEDARQLVDACARFSWGVAVCTGRKP